MHGLASYSFLLVVPCPSSNITCNSQVVSVPWQMLSDSRHRLGYRGVPKAKKSQDRGQCCLPHHSCSLWAGLTQRASGVLGDGAQHSQEGEQT